jgi:hypothetical protein
LTGTARKRRIAQAFRSSSSRCVNSTIDSIVACDVHLLTFQTSQTTLHSSGVLVFGDSDENLHQPLGFPLSFVALMYHLLNCFENSIHFEKSSRFW